MCYKINMPSTLAHTCYLERNPIMKKFKNLFTNIRNLKLIEKGVN